ncbi:helicase DnaB-like [Bacillus phage Shbh1]|uniref:Putative DNA helicase n=1 Tax=Bacillus phage Shbh1 TaxID=1796992 RepID=A0A142F1G7_9CAUD|nr:helicase DnaB-like [Bacillus phage Shbh1]AMQ66624.1 putative DNA helicase [Bacillus phage Shbh1]
MSSIIQKQILHKAIKSPFFSKEILPKTPLEAFEQNNVYKELSSIIKRYYQTNSTPLKEDALLTLVEDKLDRMRKSPEEQQKYFSAVSEIYEVRNSHDNEIIDEKIEEYIKYHMRVDLLKRAAENLKNEKFQQNMDKELREIMLLDVSGRQHEIINVIDDVELKRRALSTLHQNTIPSGFKELDRLNGGGLAKGELGLIVAASGTGKTLVLTNLATNYTKLKHNVLFIALEELENRMILRFEQSMLRQSRNSILTGSTLNEVQFNKMQNVYQKNRDKFGNLFFSRYSPRTVTPAKIEQLISDCMIRLGIRLDVVVIDYPELLRNPHATGNEADDGGKLFEEMRRIAQEYNVVMWTASQMNRTAYNAVIRTAEHMEGSHRKKNAAELVLTINQTPEEYEAGFLRLYADKVRNPPDGAYDKMLGFKVVGSAMTLRDYDENGVEMRQHQAILEEADNRMESHFKGKKREKKEKDQTPDYASEINSSIMRLRSN